MKKIKQGLVCAVVVLGLMSVCASPVARIGETEYESLDAAIAEGGEIRLVADVAVASITIPYGKTVTLDLAGRSLTGTDAHCATIVDNGSLTVNDSVGGGRITHQGAVTSAGKLTGSATAIYISGEFVLLNGCICDCTGDKSTVRNEGEFCMAGGSISNCTATTCGGVQNFGDFVFSGGAIVDCRGQYGAIANNGQINQNPTTMLITGGTVTRCYSTSAASVIYSYFDLRIEDGEFGDCGERTIYGDRSGCVAITGGRFAGGVAGVKKDSVTITGGVFTDAAREDLSSSSFLPLGTNLWRIATT